MQNLDFPESSRSCKGAIRRLFFKAVVCLMTGLKYGFMIIRQNHCRCAWQNDLDCSEGRIIRRGKRPKE